MNNTIHSSDDFEGMRKAGNLAASTLDLLVEKVKPGVSTEELDNIAFDYIVRHGGLIAPLFYKGINGELIEVKDHQAIINNQNNNLLNIPKLQYTTLQLSTIKKLISEIRGNTTIESIMNVDDKRFVFNLSPLCLCKTLNNVRHSFLSSFFSIL